MRRCLHPHPSSPVWLRTWEVTVFGRGENLARWQLTLTTATPAGVVSSLEAWPWPKPCLPISGARGNPRSGLSVWATAVPQHHSLLDDVVLVTRGVLSLARTGVDVMTGVGFRLGQRLRGRNVCHGGCAIVVDFPKAGWILPSTCRIPLGV
jgi:hypothetical protein